MPPTGQKQGQAEPRKHASADIPDCPVEDFVNDSASFHGLGYGTMYFANFLISCQRCQVWAANHSASPKNSFAAYLCQIEASLWHHMGFLLYLDPNLHMKKIHCLSSSATTCAAMYGSPTMPAQCDSREPVYV